MHKKYFAFASFCLIAITLFGYQFWVERGIDSMALVEVEDGDAQFWLMQGSPNNRLTPCVVYYHFDQPLDEGLVRKRLEDLTASYKMFQRNIVEIRGLPYWQAADVDWDKNFWILDPDQDIEGVRLRAEHAVSKASEPGSGLPLFRAFLSSDRKQLIFVWHHVISDLEGMFNKHAKHLFLEAGERTQFGYQISNAAEADTATESVGAQAPNPFTELSGSERSIGFTGTDYEVSRFELPVGDRELFELGRDAKLPMSDIFSFIALRATTIYEEKRGNQHSRPLISPISLRTSSLAMDEGNNRAIKAFPFSFPLEPVDAMHMRILNLQPTASSYDTAGSVMKFARRIPIFEPTLRRMAMPDFISNYFPLADDTLFVGKAKLIEHTLRVPMVPYERTKFAWSNYDGEVQLFLHTDPKLIDQSLMVSAFLDASNEVLTYLSERSGVQE